MARTTPFILVDACAVADVSKDSVAKDKRVTEILPTPFAAPHSAASKVDISKELRWG